MIEPAHNEGQYLHQLIVELIEPSGTVYSVNLVGHLFFEILHTLLEPTQLFFIELLALLDWDFWVVVEVLFVASLAQQAEVETLRRSADVGVGLLVEATDIGGLHQITFIKFGERAIKE